MSLLGKLFSFPKSSSQDMNEKLSMSADTQAEGHKAARWEEKVEERDEYIRKEREKMHRDMLNMAVTTNMSNVGIGIDPYGNQASSKPPPKQYPLEGQGKEVLKELEDAGMMDMAVELLKDMTTSGVFHERRTAVLHKLTPISYIVMHMQKDSNTYIRYLAEIRVAASQRKEEEQCNS